MSSTGSWLGIAYAPSPAASADQATRVAPNAIDSDVSQLAPSVIGAPGHLGRSPTATRDSCRFVSTFPTYIKGQKTDLAPLIAGRLTTHAGSSRLRATVKALVIPGRLPLPPYWGAIPKTLTAARRPLWAPKQAEDQPAFSKGRPRSWAAGS
jgi:hypothetical protein